MRFTKTILLSAAALMLPLFSQATTISDNPTLSVAGLTFNNFSVLASQTGSAVNTDGNNIKVQTITHPGNGIQFSGTWLAGSLLNASSDDTTINYHVSASGSYINNVGLYFDGTYKGFAVGSVTESIFDAMGNQVGFASVACGFAGCDRSATISLNGLYTDLFIQKDINVSSLFVGYALASNIDQTFGTVPTPEPGSLAMLGAGLIGVAGLLRRRIKLAVAKTESNA